MNSIEQTLERLLEAQQQGNRTLLEIRDALKEQTSLLGKINSNVWDVWNLSNERSFYDDDGDKRWITDTQLSMVIQTLKRIETLVGEK
jgi:hypothetical protein